MYIDEFKIQNRVKLMHETNCNADENAAEFVRVLKLLDDQFRAAEAVVLHALLSIRTELHATVLTYASKEECNSIQSPIDDPRRCVRERCETIRHSLACCIGQLRRDEMQTAAQLLTARGIFDSRVSNSW
jgi:hypothetical protein